MVHHEGEPTIKDVEEQSKMGEEEEQIKLFLDKMNEALKDIEGQRTSLRPQSLNSKNQVSATQKVSEASTLIEFQEILTLLS